MPGKHITRQQVELYMKQRQRGKTQITAAVKAGISERSARTLDKGKHCINASLPRHWRTRPDPFDKRWEAELIPMLTQEPQLQAITLLEYLQLQYPEEYPDKLLRTLQRRVKHWKATQGANKEVMFMQAHEPGRLGLSDFTTLKNVVITIQGQPLHHLLYHFRLAYSHWSYMKAILGGESFTALAEGLQEALWRLGSVPLEHRTDSLSAAFKNLDKEARKDITERYHTMCQHYAMKATRNNLGAKHENGCVESAHGHLKRRIEQALLLRGYNDFDDLSAYQSWLDQVVKQHNQRNAMAINIERPQLQALPTDKTVEYTDVVVRVTSASTIDVRRVTYTVPSRLIGENLRVRLYHNRLRCYLGSTPVASLNRVYPKGKTQRARQVNYRHVIHSLVKKPQAFRYSQLKEEMLPNEAYRTIWHYVDTNLEARLACKYIVGILYLAAGHDCEESLSDQILQALQQHHLIPLVQLQDQFKDLSPMPVLEIKQHSLTYYNQLIPCQEVKYA